MKTISEIMPVAMDAIENPVEPQQPPQKKQPTAGNAFNAMPQDAQGRMINRLFAALKMAHPFQYRSILKEIPEWETVMKRDLFAHPDFQLMTAEQVKIGVDKAKVAQFMPTNAHQFVEMCRLTPVQMGLPSEMEAYTEAGSKSHDPLNSRWSHRIVFLAGRNLWHNLRGSCSQWEHEAVRKQYIANYKALVARLVVGKPLEDEVPMAIEDQRGTVEYAVREGEIILRGEMQDRGINPDGGREEFLKMMASL